MISELRHTSSDMLLLLVSIESWQVFSSFHCFRCSVMAEAGRIQGSVERGGRRSHIGAWHPDRSSQTQGRESMHTRVKFWSQEKECSLLDGQIGKNMINQAVQLFKQSVWVGLGPKICKPVWSRKFKKFLGNQTWYFHSYTNWTLEISVGLSSGFSFLEYNYTPRTHNHLELNQIFPLLYQLNHENFGRVERRVQFPRL